jgi:hypothetical protein
MRFQRPCCAYAVANVLWVGAVCGTSLYGRQVRPRGVLNRLRGELRRSIPWREVDKCAPNIRRV